MKKYLESIIVAVVILVGIFITVNMQERWNDKRMMEIRKITDHKNLIMRNDSANAVRFRILQDSLKSINERLKASDRKIDSFNKQIRKQNAELEKLYNDMPVHGRPDF